MSYNREKVYEYAKKWAYSRNPKYYNFDPVGGDCTNFVSQCIFAGCNQMNYNKNLHNTSEDDEDEFLITNKGIGPKGKEGPINTLKIGDVIQLSFDGINFSHSLIVVKNGNSIYNTFIAAHTFDTFNKIVAEYTFEKYRCVHILD